MFPHASQTHVVKWVAWQSCLLAFLQGGLHHGQRHLLLTTYYLLLQGAVAYITGEGTSTYYYLLLTTYYYLRILATTYYLLQGAVAHIKGEGTSGIFSGCTMVGNTGSAVHTVSSAVQVAGGLFTTTYYLLLTTTYHLLMTTGYTGIILVRSARFTILDCSFVANEVDSVAGSMIDLNGGDGFKISDFRSVHMVNNTGFSTLNFNTLIAWQCQVRFEDGGW